ncbi:MAG: hypothetical protein K2X27_26185 [Candidatus Obscuribacterales bacterium]|nr:hypothetical protein [Candidatus Obscuribacterales bacterium]
MEAAETKARESEPVLAENIWGKDLREEIENWYADPFCLKPISHTASEHIPDLSIEDLSSSGRGAPGHQETFEELKSRGEDPSCKFTTAWTMNGQLDMSQFAAGLAAHFDELDSNHDSVISNDELKFALARESSVQEKQLLKGLEAIFSDLRGLSRKDKSGEPAGLSKDDLVELEKLRKENDKSLANLKRAESFCGRNLRAEDGSISTAVAEKSREKYSREHIRIGSRYEESIRIDIEGHILRRFTEPLPHNLSVLAKADYVMHKVWKSANESEQGFKSGHELKHNLSKIE